MKDKNLNKRIFDVMLQTACEEILEERIAEYEDSDTEAYEFSPEFESRMKNLLRTKNGHLRIKKAKVVLSRVAVVILIIMTAGFTVTMSVEALRVQFLNTVIETTREYVGFSFFRSDEQPADEILRPTYIPEGYLESNVQLMPPNGVRITYRNNNEDRIVFTQYQKSEGMDLQINGEYINAPYTVIVNDVYVQVFESNADGYESYVIWEIGNAFYLLTGTIQPPELIEMAKSISER